MEASTRQAKVPPLSPTKIEARERRRLQNRLAQRICRRKKKVHRGSQPIEHIDALPATNPCQGVVEDTPSTPLYERDEAKRSLQSPCIIASQSVDLLSEWEKHQRSSFSPTSEGSKFTAVRSGSFALDGSESDLAESPWRLYCSPIPDGMLGLPSHSISPASTPKHLTELYQAFPHAPTIEYDQPVLAASKGPENACLTIPRCDFRLPGAAEPPLLAQDLACSTGSEFSNHCLLGYCAELDRQDQAGFSPLHYAAMGGFVEIVAALLQGGASRSITNRRGQTALHLAVENGHQDVVTLLIQP